MSRSHILDFSQKASRLRVSHRRLLIESEETPSQTIPFDDVAVMVVSHPQITYTQAVLSSLMDAGGAFVVCGANHLPNGMLLPLSANGIQTERFASQANASRPTCKRLWQQVVRSKIDSQASALIAATKEDAGLRMLKAKVKSGDPTNIEAQAARRYWSRLFGHSRFRRDRDLEDQNQNLNYGYAVLRAIVGRAICAAGLHPTIGLHHHNRYNAFCLADDLMEPLRPLVDIAVVRMLPISGCDQELTTSAKCKIVTELMSDQVMGGKRRGLFDVASQTAVSLAQVFMGQRKDLQLPSLEWKPTSVTAGNA